MAAPADRLILGNRKGLLVLDRAKGDWRVKLRAHVGAALPPPIDSVRFA